MGFIQIKNADDIKKMREACRISNGALWAVEEYIRQGVTTQELNHVMQKYISSAGAKASFKMNGFPTCACISVNEVVIHGIPSNRKLVDGDIVSIDVGAYYNGFHGDNAYTFMVGEVAEETKTLCKVTEECLYKGIEQAIPGNRVGDISYAVQKHAEASGFSVVREFVGHGVGKELHESPEVPNFGTAGRGPRLVTGMVLAIEPMINLVGAEIKQLSDGWTIVAKSGKPSAHYEHTVVITDDGAKILTTH